MVKLPESELVLNPDKSVYHLKLKPEHIADTVILVGDPHRVEMVSNYFDKVEHKIQNREFITHSGTLNNIRIMALSTGIGTDNIDIVINELDAAINIDLNTREIKSKLRYLDIVRLGTSGALQESVPVDSFVISEYGIGFDGLLNFYDNMEHIDEKEMTDAFIRHTGWGADLPKPYIVSASDELLNRIGEGITRGITATSPGFYGPQGRALRLSLAFPDQNDKITSFSYKGKKITNYEMETSALYGLGKLLGHKTCTVCTIIANRITKKYSKDYRKAVIKMIELTLERLTCDKG